MKYKNETTDEYVTRLERTLQEIIDGAVKHGKGEYRITRYAFILAENAVIKNTEE